MAQRTSNLQRVRDMFAEGPMTAPELAAELDIENVEAAKIINNLYRLGHVKPDGRTYCASKYRRYPATIYTITETGANTSTKPIIHGRTRYEKYGCRCEVCTESARTYWKKKRTAFDQKRFDGWVKDLEDSNMADGKRVKSGVLLLAAFALKTQNVRRLQAATRFPLEYVEKCAANLRENGVWRGGNEWGIPDDVDLQDSMSMQVWFALTMLVADGEVVCVASEAIEAAKGD